MLYRILLLSFCVAFCSKSQAQTLRINEAVSANFDLSDEDGDSPDWLEIYNPGDAPVNLANWSLTDDPENAEPWIFPNMNLAAGGYLRVWASDKNRTNNAGHLHTDFKISGGGETLYLRRPDGNVAHTLVVPAALEYYAFGLPAGTNQGAVLPETTPGAANPAQGFIGVVPADIEFSHPGGSSNPLSLKLTTEVPNSHIRYTTDATLPDANSDIFPSGGLAITAKKVIRARVFRDGYLPSKTQSRFFLVNESHSLPVVSLITEPDNFFDDETGIYVLGNDYSENQPNFGANFWEDWERPLHFSFYENDGNGKVEFDCGTKIFGGWSRANDQRSLSLFARNRYGTEGFNYPFFDTREFSDFQSLVLRNSGNDWLRSNFRDIMFTGLLEGADLEIQAHRSVAAYLNGEYWGMYHLREKVSRHFLASRFDVDADEVTILDFGGEVVDGDNTEYYELLEFMENNSLANPLVYDYVAERIDLDNFMMYQVAQIYADNDDWPGNNIKFWKAPGRKWRWILYDTDFGFSNFGNADHGNNTLAFALEPDGPNWPNPPWSTFLLRKTVENPDFRDAFINRFADEMNSRFLPENVLAQIEKTQEIIADEVPAHYDRWGEGIWMFDWQTDKMNLFAERRPFWLKQHIEEVFELPAHHELHLENVDYERGKVLINNRLDIQEENWRGDYFETVPITVTAIAEPGAIFLGWEGDITSSEETLIFDLKSDTKLIPVFRVFEQPADGIIINEINYQSAANRDAGDWIELYNDNDFAADISGWTLRETEGEGEFTVPERTIIADKGYLILAQNATRFSTVYSGVRVVQTEPALSLPDEKCTFSLSNHTGEEKATASYAASPPWSQAARGQGGTLELLRPDLDAQMQKNWESVHPFGSPGATNIPAPPAYYGDVFTEVNIFPNPVGEVLDVRFKMTLPAAVALRMYDSRGILVKELLRETLAVGDNFLTFDTGDVPTGFHFLELTAEGEERKIFKIVKM